MMKHPPSSFRIHIPAVIPFFSRLVGISALCRPLGKLSEVCVCVYCERRARAPGSVVMRTFCFSVRQSSDAPRVSEHSLSLAHVDEPHAISCIQQPFDPSAVLSPSQPAYKLIFYSYSGVCFIAPNFGLICCNSESAAFELHQSDCVCEMSAHESCQNYLEQRFLFCQPKP